MRVDRNSTYFIRNLLTESLLVQIPCTTNEIPFQRLKKEGLNPLPREYIIDKINLRRVQKDCLISYAGNQYSVPAEYVGKDVAVVALKRLRNGRIERPCAI